MNPLLLAYIDPNSGGMLFQLLAAAFVMLSGLVFFFSSQIKMMVARLRRYVRERRGESPDLADVEENRAE
jgi:hypothetical protein